MSQRSFRFIHASDLHLERTPHGIGLVPDHLRELFLEAPCWAAERVFDAALSHEADFVVLAGDVIRPSRSGPRTMLFLAEQFGRLHERGIAVYWCGYPVDSSDAWPNAIRLPDNVHRFSHAFSEQFTFQRGTEDVARIIGIDNQTRGPITIEEFHGDPGGLFTIAVAHGQADAANLKSRGVQYWALGGPHARNTLYSAEHAAHYPGTTQGRCPSEAGAHGCTLVQVEASAVPRLMFVPTDVLRWHAERVVVEPETTVATLEATLLKRRDALAQSAGNAELLVDWTITGSAPLIAQLRRGEVSANLLNSLRGGAAGPANDVWSLSLIAEPAPLLEPPRSETLLGEFARIVHDFQTDESLPIDLSEYLDGYTQDAELAPLAFLNESETRQRVLRHSAALGLELLGGEELAP